jgi:hypothetical protein
LNIFLITYGEENKEGGYCGKIWYKIWFSTS